MIFTQHTHTHAQPQAYICIPTYQNLKEIPIYIQVFISKKTEKKKKIKGLPGSSADKESAYNAGDSGSIPGLRRSPEEGIGYPL